MKKIKVTKCKVHNATPIEIDGIKFKSKLEGYTYESLKKANIIAEYEPTHFTLIPAFIYNNEKIRKMTYLPDFIGNNFIIECKGMITDSFPLRWKIFKFMLHLTNKNYELYLVRNHKQVDQMIEKIKQK
jgi:hypothetical protein